LTVSDKPGLDIQRLRAGATAGESFLIAGYVMGGPPRSSMLGAFFARMQGR